MAPKAECIDALALNTRYADLLSQPPYVEAKSPYHLHQALQRRQPPISVSVGTVKQWWMKHRVSEGSVRLTTAAELEQQYGASIKHYAVEYPTAFKLCKGAGG